MPKDFRALNLQQRQEVLRSNMIKRRYIKYANQLNREIGDNSQEFYSKINLDDLVKYIEGDKELMELEVQLNDAEIELVTVSASEEQKTKRKAKKKKKRSRSQKKDKETVEIIPSYNESSNQSNPVAQEPNDEPELPKQGDENEFELITDDVTISITGKGKIIKQILDYCILHLQESGNCNILQSAAFDVSTELKETAPPKKFTIPYDKISHKMDNVSLILPPEEVAQGGLHEGKKLSKKEKSKTKKHIKKKKKDLVAGNFT